MRKKNALNDWIASCGGPKEAAEILGVTGHAVRVWLRGTSYPHLKTVQKMTQVSKGKLTVTSVLASIVQNSEK